MRAITWLLLLGLLSNIVCYDGPRFIDLSSIDSSVTHTFTEYKIQLKLPSNDGTITMSCAICDRNLIIKCTEDELINVAIQMKGLSQTFEVPINVTCNTKDNTKNKLVVETIDAHATANEVIFTWTLPNDTIQEYLVYFMTSSTHKSQQISTNRIYFDNLSEKTWHQTCIASIDNLWRTSKFTCKKVLTDFSITGPVTNIAAISDIDTISVTWNNPQYKHDIPQGYIVHINGTTNICRTIIIHMMAVHISTNDPCPHRQFLNWTHLQDLHIDKLPPYCQFNIDIIPFNKNKPFIEKTIAIQTKRKKSNLIRIPKTSSHKISLKAPLVETLVKFISIAKSVRSLKDCFNDCYISGKPYYGIRSVDENGNSCSTWQKTKYSYSIATKSNRCSTIKYVKPWCSVNNKIAYCNIPKCPTPNINTNVKCVNVVTKTITSKFVLIGWSDIKHSTPVIGYIILLHDSNNFCLNYNIQLVVNSSQGTLGNEVKNFYLSCKIGLVEQEIRYITQFNDLHQNKLYFMYIIAIVSESKAGSVKNIIFRTKLAAPDVPKTISLKSNQLKTIEMSWSKPKVSQKYGPKKYYMVFQRKSYSSEVVQHTSVTESIIFRNLEICTQYCFKIASLNNAGSSDTSKEVCQYTLSEKPGMVKLLRPESGHSNNVTLLWKSNQSDFCPKSYTIEYKVKYLSDKQYSDSNEKQVTLNNLRKNVIYTTKVRAESQMKTINQSAIGDFSMEEEFFTGLVQPNISSFNQNVDKVEKYMNLSWEIENEMKGSVFELVMQIKNSSNHCIFSILFTCKACCAPINYKYMAKENIVFRKNLLKCAKSIKKNFDVNATQFQCIFYYLEGVENISLEIYAFNLIGIHKLFSQNVELRSVESTWKVILLSGCLVIILIFLLIAFLFIKSHHKQNNKTTTK